MVDSRYWSIVGGLRYSPSFTVKLTPSKDVGHKRRGTPVHTLIILLKNYVKIFQLASTLYHLRVYKNTSAKLECSYMFGYLQGINAGPELENHLKKCKKIYKSHRRIGVCE